MSKFTLLACPFCGWQAVSIINYNTPVVQCPKCGAFGPEGERIGSVGLKVAQETAGDRWNNRAGGRIPTPPETGSAKGVGMSDLLAISERLKTQNNRITQNPMFCVQIKRRDVGYDSHYSYRRCWHDSANEQTIYDDDPDFKEPDGDGWDEFGYVDRWETVMVAFTEGGCQEYLNLNGHNDRSRAFRGEIQIYVESFNRCPEMIAIREALMANAGDDLQPRRKE